MIMIAIRRQSENDGTLTDCRYVRDARLLCGFGELDLRPCRLGEFQYLLLMLDYIGLITCGVKPDVSL